MNHLISVDDINIGDCCLDYGLVVGGRAWGEMLELVCVVPDGRLCTSSYYNATPILKVRVRA